jgi:murein L,D-transpeptidase YafK
LQRPRLHALLAPAVIAAAIALAGCNASDIPTNGRALAPLSDKMLAKIAEKNMDKNSPILVRIFKEESEMEVWKQNRDGQFALLKTYPICRWSGALGPKIKQGDRQAPEGFYTITPAQMNPNSNYYLAFNTGYPNAYDRAWGHTGSELMVHGDCSSAGCYAMTDEQIQEIYALARDSFFGGQKEFQLEAFPFRMTALNMAKHRNNPNFAFWKMLKQGYDDFEATRQEPKIAVCEKRYVFDAAPPENSSKPLSFNARGKCPVYRLDPQVADAVLDYRRHQQVKMANYIAEGVPTVPIQKGVDGGMNPVFATKLASLGEPTTTGRVYDVAGSEVPGALPHTPNPHVPTSEMQGVLPHGAVPPVASSPATTPAATAPAKPAAPVMMASVPLPPPAPLPKRGEAPQEQPKPTMVASFFGKLLGGGAQAAQPAAPVVADASNENDDNAPVALRGVKTELTAKPKHPVRVASAPVVLHPRHARAQPKPKAVAHNVPEPERKLVVKQAKKNVAPPPQMRTAYSTPIANGNGLLAGAQPVVPAGSFETRWAGLR